MTNHSKINLALFVLLACLWSGSFIGIKIVIDSWPPVFGAAVRVSIALLSLMTLVIITRKKADIPISLRSKIFIIGIFAQGIPFAFLFWGERLTSPGLAGILNGTVPIWTFILGLIFLPQSITFSFPKLLGLLIGILGIAIIFWPVLSFENNLNTLLGTCAVLVMAISYATGNILNQYLLQGTRKIDFLVNIYYQHWGSLTFLIITSLLVEKWPSMVTLTANYAPWLACLYLGVLATALAFCIYYYLIREWDGIRASSVMYIVPILTLVWDYLIFGTAPRSSEIIGVIAIIIGVIILQLASQKELLGKFFALFKKKVQSYS